MSATIWKMNETPVPQHVMQMLPVDKQARLLLMHRTDAVRSAKNVWSFPSGMHDIGECLHETARRELLEEYGLAMRRMWHVGCYENIAGDAPDAEQYHWVISLVTALVDDLEAATNKEPHKHDKFELVPVSMLLQRNFFEKYKFHRSFQQFAQIHRYTIVKQVVEAMEFWG
jgi:ADP-ribose pyrophosphatase YjhB (NUDIX family)